MIRAWLFGAALALASLAASTPSASAAVCNGHFVNPITDICWDCLFPLTLGSVPLFSGDEPDAPTWPAQPQRSLNAPRQLEVRHARPPAAAPPRALLSMCPREPPPGPLLFAFCWNHSCSARELL